ncbi:hypothetical protein ACTJJ0_23110 [Chitinophaga sp. 22321]|uniref:Uncharacterized protein n=1 Tax=Chitinophaga hostae TaxID=2831022 RepID=A0ABS5J884_9BACT|nr:hypothetical protein [Chitinophaga hostae]MBS0031421.1 hypothetical protein [Chitinophaga hostae]
MPNSHQYTDAADYINRLKFDYIDTYSLQRGTVYENQYKQQSEMYMRLRTWKERGRRLSPGEEETYQRLIPHVGCTQYLINDNGEFHSSSNRTNSFRHDDQKVDLLKRILRTAVIEEPHFLCAPIYRDGIVFYDATGKMVSSLNVCLECMYMETAAFQHIRGDYETYDLLKRFFINIGHEVENPGYFIMDEINKQRAKNNKQR